MKKILCTLLSVIMAFSALTFAVPTVASAAESQESVSETYGDFKYKINGSSAEITDYTGSAESVTIPSKIAGYNVTEIHDWAFSNCTNLKSVVIPNSVTVIDYNAFENCTNLSNITIPDSVTEVGVGAFWNTKWFNNQPDGVVYVGKAAYQYKGNMPENTKITIKQGTKSISTHAFSDDYNLSSVVIPNSVTKICAYAFIRCTDLSSIVIPNSVTYIGWGAFCSCRSLSNISIPDSVTEIGTFAFEDTKWFDNQPNGVVYAGKVAYQYKGDMSKNTRMVLKEGTQSISSGAFYGCSNLTSIVIPNSVRSIGERAFIDCSNLKSITIPKSVTDIREYAFGYSYDDDNRKYEDFIVKGYKGTAAETYAKDNGFKFVALDKPAATAVKLNLAKATLNVGQSVTLKSTVSPAKAEQKCTWTTSNAKVAIVDKNGKVVAKGAGTATITAKTANGKIAACKVTVNPAPTLVKLNAKTATIGVGQSTTLKATVSPSKASQKCTWATSNKKVATVTSGGKVVAKGVGTATITVKTYNGKKATCKITVKKAPKSVKLSKTAITLKKGKTYTLKATLSSGSAGSTAWATSNKKVATVSTKGVVTAKAKGTAYVTVKTYNGKTAKCKVVVK